MEAIGLPTFSYAPFAWLFFFAVAWILAWGSYWTLRAFRPGRDLGWPRLLGVALVLWPFVHFAYDFLFDIAFVADTDSVLEPVPGTVLWLVVQRRTWQLILLPLVGLYLAFGQHERPIGHVPFARRLRRTLQRVDTWPRRGLLTDVMHGLWLFVAVFVAYILAGLALAPVLDRLETGDESAVFDNVTPALAVALAVVAGTTEEFLFRGILQTRLRLVMPVALAIVVQGIAFGLIHAGYGTLSHILMPLLLGTALGWIALWSGVVPVIIVHIGIDLVLFLLTAADNGYDAAGYVGLALLPLSLFVALAYFVARWARARAGRPGRPVPDAPPHNP